MRPEQGWVYLIHLDEPVGSGAQHYLGWSTDPDARLETHRKGRGGRLLKVASRAGISFRIVRRWRGTRADETTMRRRGRYAKHCPTCKAADGEPMADLVENMRVYRDRDEWVVVAKQAPKDPVRVGIGPTLRAAYLDLADTPIRSEGCDAVARALAWVVGVGWLDSLDALVEDTDAKLIG